MPACHTINMNSPTICQPHDSSVHYTNITTSPSVCLSRQLSDCHTITVACLFIYQSNHSSDHHTTTKTSPYLCQSCILSVCHNTIPKKSIPMSVTRLICLPTYLSCSQTSHLANSVFIVSYIHPTISQFHGENTYEYSCTKIPICNKHRKIPFHPYINRFICPSFRQSICQLITVCCKPVENPL